MKFRGVRKPSLYWISNSSSSSGSSSLGLITVDALGDFCAVGELGKSFFLKIEDKLFFSLAGGSSFSGALGVTHNHLLLSYLVSLYKDILYASSSERGIYETKYS